MTLEDLLGAQEKAWRTWQTEKTKETMEAYKKACRAFQKELKAENEAWAGVY